MKDQNIFCLWRIWFKDEILQSAENVLLEILVWRSILTHHTICKVGFIPVIFCMKQISYPIICQKAAHVHCNWLYLLFYTKYCSFVYSTLFDSYIACIQLDVGHKCTLTLSIECWSTESDQEVRDSI